MNQEEKIIPIDAPDIVEKIEATLWKASNGEIFRDERNARYASSTHSYCSCGTLKKHAYFRCENCRAESERKSFNSRPRKKLSDLEPDELIGSDAYDNCPLGDIDNIRGWLEDFNEDRDTDIDPEPIDLAAMRLEIYRPIYLQKIDPDRFSNIEEGDEDFKIPADSPILKAIDELNKAIAESKTIIGYEATKYVLDLNSL